MDIDALLYELCVNLGFCLPPADNRRLAASPPTTIDAFTDEVIRTEGLDPLTMSSDLRAQVRTLVTGYFPTAGEVVVMDGSSGGCPMVKDGDIGVIDRLNDDGTARVVWQRSGVVAVPMSWVSRVGTDHPQDQRGRNSKARRHRR